VFRLKDEQWQDEQLQSCAILFWNKKSRFTWGIKD
jgi:hypothetical protein